jgi:hypothetical protein
MDAGFFNTKVGRTLEKNIEKIADSLERIADALEKGATLTVDQKVTLQKIHEQDLDGEQ